MYIQDTMLNVLHSSFSYNTFYERGTNIVNIALGSSGAYDRMANESYI